MILKQDKPILKIYIGKKTVDIATISNDKIITGILPVDAVKFTPYEDDNFQSFVYIYSVSSTQTLEGSYDGVTWFELNRDSVSTLYSVISIPAHGNVPAKTVKIRKSLYIRGNGYSTSNDNTNIRVSGKVKVSGNINTLLGNNNISPYCFTYLFAMSTGLVDANLFLPATAMEEGCYSYMFYNCTNLVSAPALPATILADSCYSSMFEGCTNLIVEPELTVTTLVNSCYKNMFKSCSSLTDIRCLAIDISATDCTYNWLDGVASEGTFYKHPNATSWTRGSSGIPTNWDVTDDLSI